MTTIEKNEMNENECYFIKFILVEVEYHWSVSSESCIYILWEFYRALMFLVHYDEKLN